MKISTHYYVLYLSEQRVLLYECFRDELIYIQNTGFPFESRIDPNGSCKGVSKETELREFLRKTDQHFDIYYKQDPLGLVVVGEKKNLSIFEAVTTHREAILGKVEGDYSATSCSDLGKIVWPVIKTAMAGFEKKAIHDLETNIEGQKIALGIDAVAHSSESRPGSTLFVEDDYHVKGSIRKIDHSIFLTEQVDIFEVFNDVVDVIIEKVLSLDGKVVFLNSGSLIKFQRIALITP